MKIHNYTKKYFKNKDTVRVQEGKRSVLVKKWGKNSKGSVIGVSLQKLNKIFKGEDFLWQNILGGKKIGKSISDIYSSFSNYLLRITRYQALRWMLGIKSKQKTYTCENSILLEWSLT